MQEIRGCGRNNFLVWSLVVIVELCMKRGCFWFLSIPVFWKARICISYHHLYSPRNCLLNHLVSDACLFLVLASLFIFFFFINKIFYTHTCKFPFIYFFWEIKNIFWLSALLTIFFSPFDIYIIALTFRYFYVYL